MRGSSLVWPPVLETLKPFIVVAWSGRSADDMPPDVRAAYEAAGGRGSHINLGLMALSARGEVLRAYMPDVRPGNLAFDPEAQGRYFKQQLDEMLRGLNIPRPAAEKTTLSLPEVPCGSGTPAGAQPAGVRIYLTFSQNRLNHYRTPVVEAVAMTPELQQALRYPDAPRAVTVAALRPWLEQIYPPAIMDGYGTFRRIEGALTLRPAVGDGAAPRHALLEGNVTFEMDNASRTTYSGKLQVALSYRNGSAEAETMRGTWDGFVPKYDLPGRVVERVRMTAAIESQPK